MTQIKVMPVLNQVERTTERGDWCWMPNAILDYAERGVIDALGVAVYMALARHADTIAGCYPSLGRLARMLGLSRDTVRARLYRLRDVQLIIIRRRWHKNYKPTSHYYILLEPLPLPPLNDASEYLPIYLVEGIDVNSDGVAYGDRVAGGIGDAVAGREPAGDLIATGDAVADPSDDAVAGEGVTDPKIAGIKEAYVEVLRRRRAANGRPNRLPSATKPTNTGDTVAKNKT
jgi:biotin operon repressor